MHAVEKKMERLLTVIVSIKITTQDYGRPQLLPYLALTSALNISPTAHRGQTFLLEAMWKGNIVLKEYSSSPKIEKSFFCET